MSRRERFEWFRSQISRKKQPRTTTTLDERASRTRRLYYERLEDRRMLSITVGQMRDQLVPHLGAIEYVTVVTHGFQLGNDGGDSMYSLAAGIRNKTESVNTGLGANRSAWLLDYDASEGGMGSFDDAAGGSLTPTVAGSPNHVVVLFDWAPESNEPSAGWGEAAGDALFATLINLDLIRSSFKTFS